MIHLTPKQKEILEVSLDLFDKKGFADTSMRDIAEVLNVKAASLYAHLESKEQILDWISDDVRNRFMQNMPEILSDKYNPQEKFDLIVENHLNCIYKNVKLYNVFFTNIFILKVDFKNQDQYLGYIKDYAYSVESIIKEYLVYKNVDHQTKDVKRIAKFAVNILNNVYRYMPEEKYIAEDVSTFLKEMFLYGIIGKK